MGGAVASMGGAVASMGGAVALESPCCDWARFSSTEFAAAPAGGSIVEAELCGFGAIAREAVAGEAATGEEGKLLPAVWSFRL
jgi:hypothetical protein